MNHQSKNIMLEVEQNRVELTSFDIGERHPSRREFISSDSGDYDRLGIAIGNNTHLKELTITNLSNNVTLNTANKRFYDGIRQNCSITGLYLHFITPRPEGTRRYNSIAGVAFEVLRACQEKNILTKLNINTMPLANLAEEFRLVESLRGFTNLKEITCINSNISDVQLLPIVEAIRGHGLLDSLILMKNNIGNAGCEALATLHNVAKLNLFDNNIGNEGIIAIINSLPVNNNLQNLVIGANQFDQLSVINNFCTSLCNTSSINAIYSSNHTLESITFDRFFGGKLATLLELNETSNKRHVAIKKILLYSPDIDMEPLFDLSVEEDDSERDLKALPHVISWFETAAVAVESDDSLSDNSIPDESDESNGYNLEGRKLSAIYQFATAMPMLFVPATHHDKGNSKKRKRSMSID